MSTPKLHAGWARPVGAAALAWLLALCPAGLAGVRLQEVHRPGLTITVAADDGAAWAPHARVVVEVENRSLAPVALPPEGAEPGLGFHLVDERGRVYYDAADAGALDTPVMLPPGECVRSVLDLERRPLIRRSALAGRHFERFEGAFDPALAGLAYLDLHLVQVVGSEVLELPVLRFRLTPSAPPPIDGAPIL